MRQVTISALAGLLFVGCSADSTSSTSSTSGAQRVTLDAESVGAEPTTFVAMAGHWRVVEEDAERALLIDGRAWTPGQPPADLDDRAARVFPEQASSFAVRARGAQNYPFAVARDVLLFGDGEVTTEFKLVAGETDQYAAILFGLRPDSNFLALRYNTKDGDLALWRVVDGERERLHHGGTPVALSLGTWHTLTLRVDGAKVNGIINGQPALEFTLPEAPRGRVGYWTKPDSVTAFRRFVVTHGRR